MATGAQMSSEALAWAFKQECKSSSVKFTLVALCECANYRTGRIYPSVEHLCEITGQNRKTIIGNIAELERQGVLVDTGERTGKTKQIKVYQAAMGSIPKAEPSQKRNSSENGRKQSQKRDTEPSKEPSIGLSDDKPRSARQAEEVLERWASMAKPLSLSCWEKLTPKRRRTINARISEHGFDAITQAIEHVPKSAFLRGETGNWNGANLDFFTRPDTIPKILEGQYDDRQRTSPNSSYRSTGTATAAQRAIASLGG